MVVFGKSIVVHRPTYDAGSLQSAAVTRWAMMPVGSPPVRPMPTTDPLPRMTAARLVSRLVSPACAANSRCGVVHGPSGDLDHERYVGPVVW